MKARIQRARRLVDLASAKVDEAQAALAAMRRAVTEARAEAAQCEATWTAAAARATGAVTLVEDLERQSAHLKTLRLRSDVAARKVGEAVAKERRCEQALVEVSRRRRQIEIWCERLVAVAREEDLAVEKRASDELAARITREAP